MANPMENILKGDPVEDPEYDLTALGASKVRSNIATVRTNYSQINNDREDEKIREALKDLRVASDEEIAEAVDKYYGETRVLSLLEEGRLSSVSVTKGARDKGIGERYTIELEVDYP